MKSANLMISGRSGPWRACVLGLLLLGAGFGSANETLAGTIGENAFLRSERQVLGASVSRQWRQGLPAATAASVQIGGDGIGGTPGEFGTSTPQDKPKDEEAGPSQMGTKVKAGLFSAVLPGAGQYYNGRKQKAYIMGGIEVAIWTAYFVFDSQGDSKRDDSEDWAAIYAGTSGSHPDNYWQSVGRYSNSDAYNEGLRREARALGEDPTGLVTGADQWQWVNDERRLGYSQLRADGNAAYDRRDFMILFAVVNRAVSVVDAVIGAGDKPGVLEAEVMGLDLEMEMLPSWHDPGARCVVTRRF